MSVSAPYKHFAERDALLASRAEKGYREQQRRFSAAVSASERAARTARAIVDQHGQAACQPRASGG